ncbi:ABC transporter substrate-binding protein [Pseudarthrobacter sp. NPDC089323]|jgi:ribose transport system substrate-binding protein
MMLKKPLVAMLAVGAFAALPLTACSSPNSGGSAAAAGDKTYKIAFVPGLVGDEFYISMKCGVEKQAKAEGVSTDTQGPQKFDPSLQRPILDSVVASKPDALLISPTDATALQVPIKAAADAGIKIVLVDTTLGDPSVAVSAIASDNRGGGAEAFAAIKKLNPSGGKVLVVSTDPGVSTLDERVAGFEGAVKEDSAFNYVGVQYSHNDPAEAAKLVSAALAKDPDIVGIFAGNTAAAEGSATGVRQAGMKNQVKIVGFDAGPAQIKQLKEGTVQALIAQQPEQIGVDGVKQALAALKGTEVTSKIQTSFKVITQENVDTDGADYVYKSGC